MKYDFDTVYSRIGKGAVKWDAIKTIFSDDYGDVIPTSLADMEFKTAPEVIEALHRAAEEGIFGYTSPLPDYFESVKSWMERRHGWKISTDWICPLLGVIPALNAAIRSLTVPGDKVLIQPPVYYPFERAIKNSSREVVKNPLIETNGYYTIDFEDLEVKLSDEKTTMMILCSPHNPVTRVWTVDELRKTADLCRKYNVILVADEIHNDLIYRGYKHTIIASIDSSYEDFCIVMTAPSKTFNLAGIQISNIIIPNEKMRECFKETFTSMGIKRPNYFAFPACMAAYNDGEQWLEQLIDYLEANKKTAINFFKEKLPMLKVTEPEGTYFLWVDCRALGLSNDGLEELIEKKARIVPDEGYLFGLGGDGFIRLNIACPAKVNMDIMEHIEKAVSSYLSQ